MIYSVRGTLIHKEPTFAVVECGGVGYKCFISLSTYSAIGEVNSQLMLLTHMSVKEDAMDLFGFAEIKEMECFKLLTTVSGVGAKVGLSILSEMTPDAVTLAIIGGDAKAFTKCGGVGPKLASRIVLELKDKFKGVDISGTVDFSSSKTSKSTVVAGAEGEAIAALMALGYTQGEAASVIAPLDKSLSAQDMIKTGLKELAKKF